MDFDSPNRTNAWLDFAQRSRDDGGLGLAPHQAAGLVGNLVNESGQDLNPWGPSGDNGSAWGTAQWRGDRLARLQQRPDYQTTAGQQAFMREEMDGPEAASYAALRAARTPEEAASAVNKYYERSADTSGNRERSAHDLMAQFGPDASHGALTSSMNTTRGTSPMAYANDDGGALSTNNVIGGGVLNGQPQQDGGGLMDSLGNKFGVSGLGNRILGAASALTSGTDPDQSKVLAGLRTDKSANEYSFVTLPNGNVMRVNKNGSYQMLPGNFAKEEDTTGDWNKARIASNSALSDDIDKNAKSSNTALSQISSLTKLLSGKDAPYQGPGGEAYKSALGVASMIPGINTDNLSKAQTAQAVMNEISLGMRNFAGGMPGSLSDKDLAFLRAMAPSLNNKPEANAQILSMLSKVHERNLDVQRQRDSYAKSHNGMIDDGFRRQIADYAEKNRIFPDMPTSTPSGAPGTTAPIAPGTRPPLSSFNR